MQNALMSILFLFTPLAATASKVMVEAETYGAISARIEAGKKARKACKKRGMKPVGRVKYGCIRLDKKWICQAKVHCKSQTRRAH